jgi:hypothetical protein
LSKPYSELLRRSDAALVRRIDELDAEPPVWQKWVGDADSEAERRIGVLLEQFIDVMSKFPGALIELDGNSDAIIGPGRADDVVGRSRLLAEIQDFAPSLVTGPMDMYRQQWITSGWNIDPPSEQCFIAPQTDAPAAIKPVRIGLWTSTAAVGECSMWRAYLQPGSDIRGRLVPWHMWFLAIDENVKIVEITNALEWCRFVCAYPRIHEGCLYPDWVKVAQEFDAVHMTLSAIAAAQRFSFSTPHGVIPPESWDVESTFWLKWRFSGARLVEKVGR